MQLSTMVTKKSVTVNFDGQTHTLPSSDPAYAKMVAAIKAGDHDAIRALVSRAKMAVAAGNATSDASFEVRNGVLLIDGKEVHGELSRQIMEFMNEGLPFQPLVNFYRKLLKNPSFRAVQALFSFLEKNRHPITDNGNFIAYKRVHAADSEGRMLDIHSGKFDNRPGSVLEMPRNEVDEDPTRTCSRGLHVANWDYAANHFGNPSVDVMVEVEVDPANVVAIPNDYNESKMRVCGYTVRSIVTNPNDNRNLVVGKDESDEDSEEVEETDSDCESDCNSHNDCEDCDEDCDEEDCDEDDDYEDEEEDDWDEEDDEEFDDDEEDDGSQPRPTNPVNASEPSVPMHDRATLRKMSTERLRGYQKRLVAMSTLDPQTLRDRAATLLVVREILNSRR